MKGQWIAWSLSVLATTNAAGAVKHDLKITVDPANASIEVAAQINLNGDKSEFMLLEAATILESNVELSSERLTEGEATFFGINAGGERDIGLTRYRLKDQPAGNQLTLRYRAKIDYPLDSNLAEYTRGFRETPGLISGEGIYLAGSTFWYPYFDEELIEFTLSSNTPEGWHLISQGDGTSRSAAGDATWDSAGPVDEIYLVGGPLVRSAEESGAVTAEVYLHKEDAGLSQRYLDATSQYIEMYEKLIGPYPYGKFALVENFWETGYGMPSFTLLGPRIIRFPFILTSSYPHEILHNWWGNSVFVDYSSGNWCEGLTAYMADHLLQEQRQQAHEFRRSTLQRYRNFVSSSRDFPLTEFRSRHDAATEAVGYGKTLMGFHMLRMKLGDDLFRDGMQRLYQAQRGKRASFEDVRHALESASGENLEPFFSTWTTQTGAPELALNDVRSAKVGDAYVIEGNVEQTQESAQYPMTIPVALQTADGVERQMVVSEGAPARFRFSTSSEPLALAVDPDFDVFRRLDPRETPPSIGQLFGSPAILAIVDTELPLETRDLLRSMLEGWDTDDHNIEVVGSDELQALPEDRSVWILGSNNPWLRDAGFSQLRETKLAGQPLDAERHSWVDVRRHPEDAELVVGSLSIATDAVQAVAQKLPHYGKYSYLAFDGAGAENFLKGQSPTTDSPLRLELTESETLESAVPPANRPALAELPVPVSKPNLRDHVAYLADPAREGRGVGTRGLAEARNYVREQFSELGLEPGLAEGYEQVFSIPSGPDGKPARLANLIGVVPGSDPQLDGQTVVVSAHYDHLGYGWPQDRNAYRGQIHPGADDNASGVAVMLELARLTAKSKPARSITFVAFSGEEAGLLGARYFVRNPAPVKGDGIHSVINLDSVGRLNDEPIKLLGTGSASEWVHVARGVSHVTGVASQSNPGDAEGSDQQAFLERGIPAIQIFSNAHGDYHSPADTADKVDVAGMAKVVTFVKETLSYLTERREPLTAQGAQSAATDNTTRRRVSLGTLPEFGYAGEGVKVSEIVADSAAASAGIEPGDIILAIDGNDLQDLRAYSDLLKTLQPGQRVAITIQREGRALELEATLAER